MIRESAVLLLSPSYLPNIGGVENSVMHLAMEYHREGYKVIIISSNKQRDSLNTLPKQELIDFATIFRYGSKSFIHGYFSSIKLLRYVLKVHRPKLIISRSHMLTVNSFISGARHIRYVVPGVVKFQENSKNIRWGGKKYILKYYFNIAIQALAFRVANKNFVFSQTMYDQVKSASGSSAPIEIVSPGVSSERFHPIDYADKLILRRRLKLPEASKIILGVGRLVRAKGFELAVQSLQYLPEFYVLVLVGSGPELDALKAQASDTGVADRVFFVGQTSYPELYYQAADCFVLSSKYEPFGQVLLEASFAGLPIIAFKKSSKVNTATEEIFKDFPSLLELVDDYDNKSLAQGVYNSVNSQEVRLSDFDSFIKTYNWNALAKILLDSQAAKK